MKMFDYLLACSLLLGGCALEDDLYIDDAEPAEPSDPIAGSADRVAAHSDAEPYAGPIIDCPAARVIGVLNDPNESCGLREAVPPGWVWSTMFEDGSPGVDALTQAVPSELRRYCMYEYAGGLPEELGFYDPLLEAIDASPYMDLSSVAADCRGEFPQGDLNDLSVGVELHEAFRDNIDWVSGPELGSTQDFRIPVDIAVIDTVSQRAAEDPFVDPVNQHGEYMAALIADIACPEGDATCLETIHHVLAMPRDNWATPPNWIEGGEHGTQGDLALAIYEAVGDWRERTLADPQGTPRRLVINLSLGWERLADHTTDPDRGPQRSLRTALEYASCQGALVFAAAGNNPDEGCAQDHTGPLDPAGFEQIPAPTESECAAMGFQPLIDHPVFGGPGSYRPLVHAVGGVDQFDQPLINARVGGRPRLASYAANATIVDDGLATETLTGSSVASAVASGAAALLWSYRHDLTPDEVVERLYSAGWDTGDQADFELAGGSSSINRISVCGALTAACIGMPGAECPELQCEVEPPAQDGNLGDFFSAVHQVISDPSTSVTTYASGLPGDVPSCDPFQWTELADPQPELPVCSRCSAEIAAGNYLDDDVVNISIEPSYKGSVTSATLVVYDVTRAPKAYPFDGSVVALINNPAVDVTVVTVDAPQTSSALLKFALADGQSQSNPIPVSFP